MGENPEEERSCEYITPEVKVEEKPKEEVKEELPAPEKAFSMIKAFLIAWLIILFIIVLERVNEKNRGLLLNLLEIEDF